MFSVHGSSAPPHSAFSLIRLGGHPCFLSGTAAFFWVLGERLSLVLISTELSHLSLLLFTDAL